MEVRAVEKFIRVSPKKARPVAKELKGKKAKEALEILNFSQKKGATLIAKALKSAVANAEHNYNAEGDNLFIKSILIDGGPSLKRFRPRSRGMVSHILKRTSHITVIVSDEKIASETEKKPKKPLSAQIKKKPVKAEQKTAQEKD